MTKSLILLTTLAACLAFACAEEPIADDSLQSYSMVAEGVGSVIKGIEGVVNTFVLDPSFREHILRIQTDICSSFTEALLCYRSATIDHKLTSQTVQVVRHVAAALVEVLDKDAVEAENDGGPVLDIANQLVRVFTKRPDLGKDATEAFVNLYKSMNAGCDCFAASLIEKRRDFFFVFRPFIQSIRQIVALPMMVFTGYLA